VNYIAWTGKYPAGARAGSGGKPFLAIPGRDEAMKQVILAIVVLLSCACTTLQPTAASPEELQHMITQENLLEPGDRVRLVTAEGAVFKFRVREIDLENGRVVGPKASVSIQDIVAVETREVSIGKTAVLTGGLVGGLYLLLLSVGGAFVLAGA
jgi:hypothetical protein